MHHLILFVFLTKEQATMTFDVYGKRRSPNHPLLLVAYTPERQTARGNPKKTCRKTVEK